jgi:hypothetical protein
MDLDFFFSEAAHPMKITSVYYGADRFGNDKQLFDIFSLSRHRPATRLQS